MPPKKPDLPADVGDYLDQIPLEAEPFVIANTLARRDPAKLIADQRFNRAEFDGWLERYQECRRPVLQELDEVQRAFLLGQDDKVSELLERRNPLPDERGN